MELINCIIKEAEWESRAKGKDFLSSHALGDFRKYPEFFRKKETCTEKCSLSTFSMVRLIILLSGSKYLPLFARAAIR